MQHPKWRLILLTVAPVLGVLTGEGDLKRCVIADTPGLIVGAHKGKGLGIRFLRHIERSKEPIFILDAALSDPSPERAFEILKGELISYNPGLMDRVRVLVLNKADLLSDQARLKEIEGFFRGLGLCVFYVSALLGTNIELLMHYLRTR